MQLIDLISKLPAKGYGQPVVVLTAGKNKALVFRHVMFVEYNEEINATIIVSSAIDLDLSMAIPEGKSGRSDCVKVENGKLVVKLKQQLSSIKGNWS